MRAPISMRSLFIARQVFRDRRSGVRTISVTPLLREMILQITRLGALDVKRPTQQRLCGVLFDLVRGADDIDLELALPRDPRARAFAELAMTAPGDPRSLAVLARAAGASLRTLERCFIRETGVGAWRRRVRLFHALRLLEAGHQVTQVAHDVGYATVSAFSQAFRAQFGRSPTGRTR
jgi:transcriptional regulator GlxA family with amidase domain